MIDTHAHILSEFYDNIEDVIQHLKSKNIINVINCGDSIKSSLEIIELSKKYKDYMLPVIGIHPDNIDTDYNKIKDLENLIKNNKIVGIGEIGLDYYHNKENKEEQIKLFSQQIDLAEKYNLPIIVHTRDSIQDCFNILKSKNSKGIIHCFAPFGLFRLSVHLFAPGAGAGSGSTSTPQHAPGANASGPSSASRANGVRRPSASTRVKRQASGSRPRSFQSIRTRAAAASRSEKFVK